MSKEWNETIFAQHLFSFMIKSVPSRQAFCCDNVNLKGVFTLKVISIGFRYSESLGPTGGHLSKL